MKVVKNVHYSNGCLQVRVCRIRLNELNKLVPGIRFIRCSQGA